MSGIEKVIDELGWLILSKDARIESLQEDITYLKEKIESIECYIDALGGYTDACDRD